MLESKPMMADAGRETQAKRLPHYRILDALRFILALWVAIGHCGPFPLFAGVDTATSFGRLVSHAWSSVVFGTPAVIVFFVISGFCIHLPFRGSEKLAVGRYYLRRYTRILIPVAGAVLVYRATGMHMRFWGEHSILWESPLWSLACEEIYYAAYPVLRWTRARFGWNAVLPVSFAAAAGEAATHAHAVTWHAFGPFGTALILLPVWLLGCLLAEQSETLQADGDKKKIWFWRFSAWLGCWTAEMLHFKAGIPYTQTMLWFGILAYWWVRKEIAHGKESAPNRCLAAAGAWSYSLYFCCTRRERVCIGSWDCPTLGTSLLGAPRCFVVWRSLIFSTAWWKGLLTNWRAKFACSANSQTHAP